jgi:hypothetical protein
MILPQGNQEYEEVEVYGVDFVRENVMEAKRKRVSFAEFGPLVVMVISFNCTQTSQPNWAE